MQFNHIFVLSFLALVSVNAKDVTQRPVPFINPVRSVNDDRIKAFPGLISEFKPIHYSGYLKADKRGNRFFHYWLSESLSHPSTDPFVVWIGGGYSCSSLMALFTQVGPMRILDKKTVVENPYAWNKRANIFFIDFPVGSGFSYSVNESIIFDGEDLVNRIYFAFIQLFNKFPDYKRRTLFFIGEDYTASHVLALANKTLANTDVPFGGVLLNAPYIDRLEVLRGKLRLARWWEKYPLRYYVDMGRNNCCARSRQKDCIDIDRRDSICYKLVKDALEMSKRQISNTWKINDECPDSDLLHLNTDRSDLIAEHEGPISEYQSSYVRTSSYHQLSPKYGRWSLIPPMLPKRFRKHLKNRCIDDSVVEDYLNTPKVRIQLNIPAGTKPFSFCTHRRVNYGKIFHPSNLDTSALLRDLIMSPKKPGILIYHGELNWEINSLSLEPFLSERNITKVRGRKPWYINARREGSREIFGGISHYTIKDAGYRVGSDQPAVALHMFNQFLDGLLD